jgi:hypothetical protein
MNSITVEAALRSGSPQRTRPYSYKKGKFLMTASFRSSEIDWTRINLVRSLATHFSQRVIADLLGTSTTTIGKMIRIGAARYGS